MYNMLNVYALCNGQRSAQALSKSFAVVGVEDLVLEVMWLEYSQPHN